jgi:MFS family permease
MTGFEGRGLPGAEEDDPRVDLVFGVGDDAPVIPDPEAPQGPQDPAARDRRLLYAAAFLRALATALVGVLLGLHLARLGLSAGAIGGVVAAGLAGAAVAALLVTLRGDRLGRRRALAGLALLAAAGGLGLAFVSRSGSPGPRATLATLAGIAFLGMVNGMGRDRGAALILEQAALPAAAPAAGRTRAFAWYNVLQDAGHAAGSLLAGLPAWLGRAGIGEPASYRAALLLYAALLAAGAPLYARLSPAIEATRNPSLAAGAAALSPESRRVLARICGLFALDGLGGGLLTTALVSYFFFERFGAGAAAIGLLFAAARVANALSHLGAAWLAARIGLVNTMVFTHLPSSFLLLTVAFAPSFPVAAALFLLREGLVEMDVPTRQSYVMAVVRPEERTVASGATHIVRLATWAAAPAAAGLFMQRGLATPLVLGAALKIAYDLLLYRSFRHLRPPEERR